MLFLSGGFCLLIMLFFIRRILPPDIAFVHQEGLPPDFLEHSRAPDLGLSYQKVVEILWRYF